MKIKYDKDFDKLIITRESEYENDILERFTLFEIRCYFNKNRFFIAKIKEKTFKSNKFELIQEIRKLIKNYFYYCYYTDKDIDYMNRLEKIVNKYDN